MPTAVRLAPYAFSGGLALSLTDFDDPVSGRKISPKRARASTEGEGDGGVSRAYDFTQDGHAWEKLTFKIKAKLEPGELRRVLPAGADSKVETTLLVSLSCPPTKYRHALHLEPSGEGKWTGYATLQRVDVKGSVQLRPLLVRATDLSPAPSRGGRLAIRAGSILATGVSVLLHVDTSRRIGTDVFVVTTWEDFSISDNPWRKDHSDNLFELEPYADGPRLFLNARYSELRELLDSKARTGPEAALRDMAAAMIAQGVWLQLTMVAAGAVTYDAANDVAAEPGEGWKRDLLTMVLPGVYPDESDADDRLRRLAIDLRDAGGVESLAARLGSVVQDLVAEHKVVETAIRAHESVRYPVEVAE